MQLKKNPVKQALREGRTVFGLYIAVPEPTMDAVAVAPPASLVIPALDRAGTSNTARNSAKSNE